jgi:membrane fusion protein (multidrug efflux system)
VLGRIQPGQVARLRLDGFPWAQYGSIDAKVSRVASEIRDGQARVEFAIAPASAMNKVLQHGLPGSIEVNVDQAAPAVMILRAAGQMLSTSPQPQPIIPSVERMP